MSTISCTIRGNPVQILADTSGSSIGGAMPGMAGGSASSAMPTITAAIEVRDVLKLTVIDASGTAVYYRGDPVVLTDSVSGDLYRGFVQTSDPTKLSPDPASTTTFHTITCMDKQYLFDKRTNTQPYLNMVAGDIAVDLVRRVGVQEGVTVAAAMDRDTTQADFASGTLSGTVATLNVGDGDLELVTAGSPVTITEASTADFASGTLANVASVSNSLMPTTQSAISLTCQLLATLSTTNILSMQFWSGSSVVGTLDTLTYDIWIAGTSPAGNVGIDLLFSDATTLSGAVSQMVDQNYLAATPATDLSSHAKNTWYTRTIALSSAYNGKTVIGVMLTVQGNTLGTYGIYVKNVSLASHAGTPFFATNAVTTNVNPPTVYTISGYIPSLTLVSVVQTFAAAVSTRISPAHSISAVALVRSSNITWVSTTPNGNSTGASANTTGSSVAVSVSYDGSTFLACTNNAPLPGLPAGSTVAGLSLTIQEMLAGGTLPTDLPTLYSVAITLGSAASATKSDITTSYGTSAQWNAGTLSGTAPNANGDLTLGSYTRNWNDHLMTNQTVFTDAFAPTQSAATGAYVMTTVNSGAYDYAATRFDFLGPLLDFVADFDCVVIGIGESGLIYRTTGWCEHDNNYAYAFIISVNTIQFGYGQNNSGALTTGTYTNLITVAETLNINTTYHFKVVVIGSRHQIYFNHAARPAIDVVDTTYAAPGNIGMYMYGGTSGSPAGGSFDNLTITPTLFGTWQSASVSLSSLGTTGGSVISWLETLASGAPSTTAIVQTSINGGSSWQSCISGAPISGLSAGTSVSGMSLLCRITLFSSSISAQPVIGGFSWRVLGTYPGSSGTRVSPVLSLSPAVRAGSSSVSWNAALPAGTSLVVATSPDNITYTTITASGNPIASIYPQPAPQIDVFTTNTLANYTNTFKSGGSVATVTYTTANSRLTLASGSGAVYLFTAISRADVDLVCDMDASDAGGLVWRYVNNLNYYELGIYDDSSSGGFTSQARLYKVAAGVRSLLGSASPIIFPRGTPGQSPYSRVHVTMAGAVITVYFEGAQVQTYTDGAPLAAGQMGLRNDGGTSRYYQLRLQPLGDLMTGQNLYVKETLTTSDPAMMPQLLDLTTSVRGPGLATGALIPQLHAPTVPIAEFLNTEMNSITTASGDYYWNISNAGALTFAMRNAVPAPWCLFSTDLIYEANVTPTSTSDLYRNRQNITNCTGITTLLHEQMITDGSASSWKTLNPIYSAPAISVNGIVQTVGVQSVDTGKQFYWTSNSTSFGQAAAAAKLPVGYLIDIWYIGQFITTVTVDNAAEQTARAAVEVGTSGIVEASENGQGMLASAATTYAQGLLARYGLNNAVQMVGATSRPGLAPGMLLPVFLPEHQLGNAQMLVTGVNTTMQQQADGSVLYFYQVTATQGSNLANWTKVFGF